MTCAQTPSLIDLDTLYAATTYAYPHKEGRKEKEEKEEKEKKEEKEEKEEVEGKNQVSKQKQEAELMNI